MLLCRYANMLLMMLRADMPRCFRHAFAMPRIDTPQRALYAPPCHMRATIFFDMFCRCLMLMIYAIYTPAACRLRHMLPPPMISCRHDADTTIMARCVFADADTPYMLADADAPDAAAIAFERAMPLRRSADALFRY